MKAPFALFRDAATYGPLVRVGTFRVYRKGDDIQVEHEAEVAALTQKPEAPDVVGNPA